MKIIKKDEGFTGGGKPSKDAVQKETDRKTLLVYGESFIVDYKYYHVWNNSLADLSSELAEILGPSFIPQKNHHSTVLSARLAPLDINDIEETEREIIRSRTLDDVGMIAIREYFSTINIEASFQSAFIGSTIQVVFRDETELPALKHFIMKQGAQVKPGTIDGDRINTCTAVLGFFTSLEEVTENKIEAARNNLNDWITKHQGNNLHINLMSLINYRDFSLNQYEEIMICRVK